MQIFTKTKIPLLLLTTALILWAMVLRLYGITTHSFWMDEGFSIALAQAIADHGYPLLDSGIVNWSNPFYHYLLAGIVALFGTGELATRLLSIIAGMLTVALITQLARLWFSPRAAYIVFILSAFSYWEIAWSRQARMYMLLQLLLWATVAVTEWVLQRKKNRLLPCIALALTSIALAATHQIGLLFVCILPLRFLLYTHFHGKKPFAFTLVYPLTIFVLIISASAFIKYQSGFPFTLNYWAHYTQFLVEHHLLILILAFIGTLITARKEPRIQEAGLWLLTIFCIGFALLSLGIPLLQYRYLFPFLPALFLLAAYAIDCILQQARWKSITLTVLLLSIALWRGELQFLPKPNYLLESDSPTSTKVYKSFTPQPDFRSAYNVIATYNPDILITPYPELSRLYNREDTYSFYVDFSGRADAADWSGEGTKQYTGTPYLTIGQLRAIESQSHFHGIILIDYFAEKRMNPELREYIAKNMNVIYTDAHIPWSSITIYEF